MPLIDLKTNLKSLKYGNDRPGGGDSGQPYQKVDINTVDSGFNRFRMTKFDDGFVRGGIVGATNAAVVDTLRIGKFLTDLPKGPLWVVKQVGLQLSNPKLEARAPKTGIAFLDRLATVINDKIGIGPTRIYNLGINTIAQVPVNALGIHFNRHGLLPVQDDNTKYLAVVKNNNLNTGSNNAKLPQVSTNRLLRYASKLLPAAPPKSRPPGVIDQLLSLIPGASLFLKPQQQVIDDYIGGPGSVYGIGKTFIKRYDYTANGVNKQQPQDKGTINYPGLLGVSSQYFGNTERINPLAEFNEALGFEEFAPTLVTPEVEFPTLDQNVIDYKNNKPAGANGTSNSPTLRKYSELKAKIDAQAVGSIFKFNENKNTTLGITSGSDTYNGNINSYITTNSEIVYKNGLKDKKGNEITVKISGSWATKNRETRIGSGRQDSINLTPIFSNSERTIGDKVSINGKENNINDLVKFRIQSLKSTTDNNISGDWMIFRAYLTQFSDNTDANWNEIKYAGRGDKFYVYDGFSRKINIGFKVAALSSQEMEPMYQKLNYLMGNVMPDYSEDNLMRGPLVRMTVGNWIDGQDGILNNVSYTVPQDSPWEIAINEPNTGEKILILPHIVEVTMTFTPIGSQTRGKNLISSKSYTTSHIAQNANEASSNQYIASDNQIPVGKF
jgi:hypothetical protein